MTLFYVDFFSYFLLLKKIVTSDCSDHSERESFANTAHHKSKVCASSLVGCSHLKIKMIFIKRGLKS